MVAKVGGTNITKKIGGEDVVIGHNIRCTIRKNKTGVPFRKAEFTLMYDGSSGNPNKELAELAILKGVLPKYSSDGTPNPKGRTFIFDHEDEHLFAKSRQEVEEQLANLPKIRTKLLQMLCCPLGENSGQTSEEVDEFDEMTEDEFEKQLLDEEDENLFGEADEISYNE